MKAVEEIKILRKVKKVIDSCKTLEQLNVAERFVQLASKSIGCVVVTGIEGIRIRMLGI